MLGEALRIWAEAVGWSLSLPLCICLCLTFCLLPVDRPTNGQHSHISYKGKACVHSCYYEMETCCPSQENTLCNWAGHQNKYKVLQSISLNKHSLKIISQKQGKNWSANIVSTSQMHLLLVTALWMSNCVTIILSQTLFLLISFNFRWSDALILPTGVQLVETSESPLTSTKLP